MGFGDTSSGPSGSQGPRDVLPSDPLPRRGSGAHPDGAATLALYLRYAIQVIPLVELPNPTIDSLPLKSKELAELCPPKPDAGMEWELSEALSRQSSRILGPGDEDSMPQPHEVTTMKLVGKVQVVQDGVAHLVYQGAMAGSHLNQAKKRTHGEGKLTGVGRYDLKAGRLLSLMWVFNGVYKGPPPFDQPASNNAVVEWTREQSKK